MGIWSALSGVVNATTQSNNATRKTKAVSKAQAGFRAGRGNRRVGGGASLPVKKSRGW